MLRGGPDGNEVLTTVTGAILLVLLAVIGVTIVRIGQLLWLHLFLGLLLIGPVALKLASTGYRFVRYYTFDAGYRAKGPPWLPLRLIAPIVVVTTVGVFVTGVVLLIVGPGDRSTWLLLHKVFFIVWVVFMSAHVLGHLGAVGRLAGVRSDVLALVDLGPGAATGAGQRELLTGPAGRMRLGGDGSAGRGLALAAALVCGTVIAVALIPDFAVWHHYQVLRELFRHRHG